MKKKVVVIIIIAVVLSSIIIVMKTSIYTSNYAWTNELITAINGNNADRVQELLEDETMNINKPGGVSFPNYILFQPDDARETPFEAAIYNANPSIIAMVVRAGADPNFESENAICYILENMDYNNKEYDLIELLLKKGSDPDGGQSKAQGIPLMSVAMMEPINDSNNYDKNKEQEIIRLYKLVYEYCDNKRPIRTADGCSPLNYAAYSRNAELVKYLVDTLHYSVNEKADDGQTPLMAVFNTDHDNTVNVCETVNVLLDLGADQTVKDDSGKTAYYYASELGMSRLLNVE